MEEEEQKYNEAAIVKQDKILDTWMETVNNCRGTGQQSMTTVCDIALKSIIGYKQQVKDTEDEIDFINK